MTIEYTINEHDLLTHQLFLASQSERIKKKRQKNKTIFPLAYGALGLLFFSDDQFSLATIFIIIGLLWFFFYPAWEKRRYIKHYRAFIKENYKDRIGKVGTLELSNDFILAKENGSESKVLTTELEEISEIPTMILIKLRGGQSFILPKDKIVNIANVKTRLDELAAYLKIKYDIDEKWEWK